MTEVITNVNDIQFEEVKEPVQPVVEVKTKPEWRDELLGLGLKNNGLAFKIEAAISPIYLSIADNSFSERFGNNPRVTIPRSAEQDNDFITACEQSNLKLITNAGLTIEGYDFLDKRTSQELVKFLVDFEHAYRSAKNAA